MIGFIVALTCLVYAPIFFHGPVLGGDWPHFFPNMIEAFPLFPPSWSSLHGNGLGGGIAALFLDQYLYWTAGLSNLTHIPWEIVSKLFWFALPIFLSFAGAVRLAREEFPDTYVYVRFLSGLIYSTNTYILMIVSGGQMGIALAYGMVPWCITYVIRVLHSRVDRVRAVLYLGCISGVLLSFDPRIAYVAGFGACLYLLAAFVSRVVVPIVSFALAGVIALLWNAYWIIPVVFVSKNPLTSLGASYTSVDSLRFFSFADFSHALSLLHPNWPENIFGKTYFLQPEFLLLPFIAYASVLFLRSLQFKVQKSSQIQSSKKQNVSASSIQHPALNILICSLVALFGAFFAKGANEPLGGLYVWMFEHVPGFVMFRDPTKFYVLIALSYAVLIPNTLVYISTWTQKKIKVKHFLYYLLFAFFIFWAVFHRQAFAGQLPGTFTSREVPQSYADLKSWQEKESEFFRMLWVPRQSRFTYTSSQQLAVEADPLLEATDAATLKIALTTADIQDRISSLGIRYVVVPQDPYAEIFQEDRKYSDEKRKAVETVLDGTPWLTKVRTGNIPVYQTPDWKDHIWVEGEGTVVSWKRIRDDRYEAIIEIRGPSALMFSENYHPGWQVHDSGHPIDAKKERYGIMSFALTQTGSYTVTIAFEPNRFYVYGRWVSFVTVITAFLVSIYVQKTNKQKKR